jgi:hypothetical protein
MASRISSRRAGRAVVVLLALVVTATAGGQSATLRMNGGALHVTAPSFHFIKGPLLERLRDGQSARVLVAITVFGKPGADRLAERQGRFILSYDLWEERFAVTDPGTPSRSASHLTAEGAEAWCLDRLAVAFADASSNAAQVWVRLESNVTHDDERGDRADGYTLPGLIDRLSRRASREMRESLDLGPLRIVN